MLDFLSEEVRRNPFPLYEQMRSRAPLFHDARSGHWLIFDYEGVKRALSDVDAFSSQYGPEWLVFIDPPRHTKLRALIARAFTPRSIANLEPRIRELSRGLLERKADSGQMDLVADYSAPLPMLVIAEMLGIPLEDRARLQRWSDVMLAMSYSISDKQTDMAKTAIADFKATTAEMDDYLKGLLEERQATPKDDLLTRLVAAEIDGERLTHTEMLGFFQGLLLAGSETTMNLITNAMLCFLEHPDQLARLRAAPALLPAAIEEVLRYRSPLQWMARRTRRETEAHGQVIPPRSLVLTMIGSANHDPKQFDDPSRFNIRREPNPHLAFGHGIHFCLGAPLARLEAKVALGDLLTRLTHFERASGEPWEPRKGSHVFGPNRLPIHFEWVRQN